MVWYIRKCIWAPPNQFCKLIYENITWKIVQYFLWKKFVRVIVFSSFYFVVESVWKSLKKGTSYWKSMSCKKHYFLQCLNIIKNINFFYLNCSFWPFAFSRIPIIVDLSNSLYAKFWSILLLIFLSTSVKIIPSSSDV